MPHNLPRPPRDPRHPQVPTAQPRGPQLWGHHGEGTEHPLSPRALLSLDASCPLKFRSHAPHTQQISHGAGSRGPNCPQEEPGARQGPCQARHAVAHAGHGPGTAALGTEGPLLGPHKGAVWAGPGPPRPPHSVGSGAVGLQVLTGRLQGSSALMPRGLVKDPVQLAAARTASQREMADGDVAAPCPCPRELWGVNPGRMCPPRLWLEHFGVFFPAPSRSISRAPAVFRDSAGLETRQASTGSSSQRVFNCMGGSKVRWAGKY